MIDVYVIIKFTKDSTPEYINIGETFESAERYAKKMFGNKYRDKHVVIMMQQMVNLKG